jgi:hypothetical protein
MENVLAGLNLKICCAFIDDVIIFGKTYEEQLHNLQLLLGVGIRSVNGLLTRLKFLINRL